MPVYGYNAISNHEFKLLENELFMYLQNSGILTEAIFSKKQLQDPNTLTKLLEKAEREKHIKKVVDVIFFGLTILESIAVGILTKHVSIGLISWIPFIVLTSKIASKLDVVMYETQKKRIKQLREKCQKLIDKYSKIDDPKAKEIVTNCKKTIDTIDSYYKKEEDRKIKEKISEYTHRYKSLVNIIHSDGYMDEPDGEIYALAKILNIDIKRIEDGMKKYSPTDSIWIPWFGTDKFDELEPGQVETVKIMSNYIPEFKNGDKVPLYYYIDDTVFFYSKKSNKFYYGDYYYADHPAWKESEIPGLIFSSIYNDRIMNSKYSWNDDYEEALKDLQENIELLKIVDIKLGYYLLSPAPEGVTTKKI